MEPGTKFCPLQSRMLVLAVVFISLSGSTLASETRMCHWCGPLADQVHRSRVAPPCDARGLHVIACEPGLDHCAVIATSPPYVESRLCSKFYQDECYSRYCNSTKSWRMTCACRGDLCNGPNTEREHEAFELLAKMVAKSEKKRSKRTLISSSSFINDRKYKIDNVTDTLNNNMIENDTKDATDEQPNQINSVNSVDEIINTGTLMPSNEIEKVEIPEAVTEFLTTKEDNREAAAVEIIKEDNANVQHEEAIIIHDPKPSELPTAEALQQNASPVEKSTEPTPVTTTTMVDSTVTSTIDNKVDSMMTIEPVAPTNNSAITTHKHILTPIIGIMVHNYF